MSSLRISHQNRALGALGTGGDTGRSEHADDGESFAVALGAAAGVVPKGTMAQLGSQLGDSADGSPAARKRTESQVSAGAVGSVAASIIGALVGAPAVAATAGSGDGAAAAAMTDATTAAGATIDAAASLSGSLSSAAPLVGTGPAVAGTIAKAGRADAETGIAPAAAAVQTAPLPAVAPTPSQAVVAVAFVPATALAAPSLPGAGSDANAAPSGQGQVDPTGLAGSAVASSLFPALQPARMPISGPAALPAGVAASPAFGHAPADVTTDASGAPSTPAAPPLAALGAGLPSVAAGALSALPSLAVAQPGPLGDAGPSSFSGRGRFASIVATQDGGNVVATAATLSSVPAPAASAAGAISGSSLDPASAGTVADQVATHLARMVSNGSREMVVRLHPPELGDLTVRVAVSGRDVSAWFASPQPQVQSAISAALGQLQSNLGNAGYNLNGAWVGADTSSARQQQGSFQPMPTTNPAASASVASLPAAAAASRPSASGLNIYV